VLNYRSAPAPKAAALHASGVFTVVTGAASSLAAQEQALANCNNDPAPGRADTGGPCYLYAVDNQVVLAQRLIVPLSLHETLVARLAAAAVSLDEREARARDYAAAADHKAIAASPEAHFTFRTGNWSSGVDAEASALEGCQIRFGTPCVLAAVDASVEPISDAAQARRDMPRLHYAGEFEPEQIPRIRPEVRRRADVLNYRAAAGPKAAAIHAVGVLSIVTKAESQFAAEEKALAQCNSDPDPARVPTGGPCYLYASGNLVVLPERITRPRKP
jgi:hypothetical protein